MKLCKVIGFASASIKAEGLGNDKLVVVKGVDEAGKPAGEAFLAIDRFGAGLAEIVAVATGAPATRALGDPNLPVDAVVVGIIDHLSINKKEIITRDKEE